MEKLENDAIRSEYHQKINEQLRGFQETNLDTGMIYGTALRLSRTTEQILQLMDESRRHKNSDINQYYLLNSRVSSEIKSAKKVNH